MSVEDKDVLETLTDEEREALQESEYSSEELAAMNDVAGDDGEDEDGDDDDAAVAPVEGKSAADDGGKTVDVDDDDPEPDHATPAADASAASAPVADSADDDDEAERLPRYQVSLPEDFDAQVNAINEDLAAANEKFRSGEIEFADFQSELSRINTKRDELSALKIKADLAQEMNEQAAQQEWAMTVNRFLRDAKKTEGIDYRADEAKNRDLDLFVKAIAADPANQDKPLRWFIAEAHAMVKAKHGIASAPKAADKKPDGKPTGRKPPLASVPKTLAGVPGGDGPGDVAGEFSDLDGLDGLELEDAIAKMTPAQRERWLKAA
jgi:hypothetical protein